MFVGDSNVSSYYQDLGFSYLDLVWLNYDILLFFECSVDDVICFENYKLRISFIVLCKNGVMVYVDVENSKDNMRKEDFNELFKGFDEVIKFGFMNDDLFDSEFFNWVFLLFFVNMKDFLEDESRKISLNKLVGGLDEINKEFLVDVFLFSEELLGDDYVIFCEIEFL